MNNIYLLNKECRDKCDEYFKLDVSLTLSTGQIATFTQCFNTPTGCFSYDSTRVFYYEKDKRCWKQVPNGYFVKNDAALGNENELVEKCEKFYYIDANIGNRCTTSCKNHGLYFLPGNDKCEANCTNFHKNFFDPSNNECLDSCQGRPTYKFQSQLTSTPSSSISCLNQCPNNNANTSYNFPYFDSDSNICLNECGNNDPLKYYHAVSQYICYSSCAEIPGGQYIYENGHVCHITQPTVPDCPVYYIRPDGKTICATKSYCINTLNYKYFVGNECRDNCDGFYKLETNDGTFDYTKCFESLTDVLKAGNGVMAYNIKDKLCWDDIPNNYFVNSITTETGGTGLKYEVVQECEFFYYLYVDPMDSNKRYKKCISSCMDSNLPTNYFYIQGQKNCETSCLTFNKHYYNPNNHECLDTCKGLTNFFFAKKIEQITDINGDRLVIKTERAEEVS